MHTLYLINIKTTVSNNVPMTCVLRSYSLFKIPLFISSSHNTRVAWNLASLREKNKALEHAALWPSPLHLLHA